MTNKTKFQKIKSFLSTYVPGLSSVKAVKEAGGLWFKDLPAKEKSSTKLDMMQKKLARKKMEKAMRNVLNRHGFKKSTETKTRPITTVGDATIGDFRTLNVVSEDKK